MNYFLEFVPVGPEDDHDSNDDALARMLPRYLGSALDFYDVFLKGRLYLPHPGTDETPWRAIHGRPSEQHLKTGGSVQAYLELTVA